MVAIKLQLENDLELLTDMLKNEQRALANLEDLIEAIHYKIDSVKEKLFEIEG